jgi:hypothetical protein
MLPSFRGAVKKQQLGGAKGRPCGDSRQMEKEGKMSENYRLGSMGQEA